MHSMVPASLPVSASTGRQTAAGQRVIFDHAVLGVADQVPELLQVLGRCIDHGHGNDTQVGGQVGVEIVDRGRHGLLSCASHCVLRHSAW
jgi:hypothetical protein